MAHFSATDCGMRGRGEISEIVVRDAVQSEPVFPVNSHFPSRNREFAACKRGMTSTIRAFFGSFPPFPIIYRQEEMGISNYGNWEILHMKKERIGRNREYICGDPRLTFAWHDGFPQEAIMHIPSIFDLFDPNRIGWLHRRHEARE